VPISASEVLVLLSLQPARAVRHNARKVVRRLVFPKLPFVMMVNCIPDPVRAPALA